MERRFLTLSHSMLARSSYEKAGLSLSCSRCMFRHSAFRISHFALFHTSKHLLFPTSFTTLPHSPSVHVEIEFLKPKSSALFSLHIALIPSRLHVQANIAPSCFIANHPSRCSHYTKKKLHIHDPDVNLLGPLPRHFLLGER